MTDPALGFIGLGKMGTPMALRLCEAGQRVTVFNRSPARTIALRDAGAEIADSPATLATDADIVFLCLTDSEAVEEMVFGAEGVAAAGAAGKLLVDCSSISPAATRRFARQLETAAAMGWIDAPVSGGVDGARRGKLVFMCGGEAADIERVRPVLARMGQRTTHMGPVGSGQMTKLCNQAIVSCNLAAIAEAVNLAMKAGVDAARLPEALAGGYADSLPLQIYGPRMAGEGSAERKGAIATMWKDIRNALEQAHALGAVMPMTARASELYRQVADSGREEADLEGLMYLYSEDSAPPS